MTKIILRPERNERTPKALSDALGTGWTTKRWPGFTSGQANFASDFLMIYPEASRVIVPAALTNTYAELREYYQKNKPNQRMALGAMGLPIAKCATTMAGAAHLDDAGQIDQRFVVRPLRHEGGQDYRITTNPLDFVTGSEYISELFPKEREYRLLYVFGQLTMMWQKRKADNETDDGPWGAEGHSAFLDVTNWESSYLFRNTDACERIGNTIVARNSHIVAFDVLYSHTLRSYVVLETNVCPALYWSPTAITKVVEAINNRPVLGTVAQTPQSAPAAPVPHVAATPVQTTRSPFRLQVPARPVVRLITIDFFGTPMELTVAEIDGIITQLNQAKAA